MTSLHIRSFNEADEQGVIDVILPIQRAEFGIAITEADQPDLRDIPSFYQVGCGDFWVAENDGRIIGTAGLRDIGAGRAALRKMFVAAPFRGREHGVAQALLHKLIADARGKGVKEILLGTTDRFLAAHRFYERNGFQQVTPETLPQEFPRMAVDTRFYRLALA